mgnify:FL=1
MPPFEEILEIQKLEQDLPLEQKKNVPEQHPDFHDFKLKFYLQPNDLVYIPVKNDEDMGFENLGRQQLENIYLFKDGSGTTANFIPMFSADVIYNISNKENREKFADAYNLDKGELIKNEYGLGSPQLKNQNSVDGIQVKSVCWKLQTDRLGNITKVLK